MMNTWHPRTVFFCCLFATALLAIALGENLVKAASAELPENATARSYGGGWECDRGFQEARGPC